MSDTFRVKVTYIPGSTPVKEISVDGNILRAGIEQELDLCEATIRGLKGQSCFLVKNVAPKVDSFVPKFAGVSHIEEDEEYEVIGGEADETVIETVTNYSK